MTVNGSMAVWCRLKNAGGGTDANGATGPNPTIGPTAEVHVNYWHILGDAKFVSKNRGKARNFAEIGLLICEPTSIEDAYIYLPGVAWKIEDCGPRFASVPTSEGIFNESLSYTESDPTGGPHLIDLRYPNQNFFCRVHCFRHSGTTIQPTQLEQTKVADGLLLHITPATLEEACRQLPTGGKLYFRLRAMVTDGSVGPFIRRIPATDFLFHSSYSEIEYIDFRLNEARTLPKDIDHLLGAARAPLTLVAFLAAVPVLSELMDSGAEAHKKRLLESSIWNAYAPDGIPDGMVIYHWKKTREDGTTLGNPVEDFSAFVKMETRRNGWRTLLPYIIVAFLFGVAGNLTASFLWEKIFPSIAALFHSATSR